MMIDLHVHTIYSGDNDLDPRQLFSRARELGLDALCVTEHNSYEKSAPVLEVAAEMNFPVFRGAEIATTLGHLLVYGVKDDGWIVRKFWGRLPGEDVLRAVARAGGVVVAAHPCKAGYQFYGSRLIAAYPVIVGLEVCNGVCSKEDNRAAARLAAELGLPGTGGSDAHRFHEIGRCCTEIPGRPGDETELAAILRAGDFRAVKRRL
ncbi:MAG: CehA/McbA family metallohydrolase [bacterium]|jgi:predicted metal-dependent phosphoesterase TrpH